MRARSILVHVAVAACLAGTAGCSMGLPSTQDAGTSLVGVAMPTTDSARWIADGTNVSAQLEALGHDVDLEYAENDPATQATQLQAMVDAGADALIVAAVDGTALTEVLAEAHRKGIPVISYDRLIRDSPDIDYYASFDNARVGVMQGTTLLQGLGLLGADGKPTGEHGPFAVELFAGSADDNNASVFYAGAMQVLQPWFDSGDLVVPSDTTAFADVTTKAWAGDVAAERMTSLLPLYADQRLDGVLSPYDGISRGILDVLGTVGYGTAAQPWPVITGQDAEADSVKLIRDGVQYSTVFKDTRQLAEVSVSMVEDLLRGREPVTNDVSSYDNGKKVVPAYLLPPQAVTAGNFQQVLVESNYYTDKDLS